VTEERPRLTVLEGGGGPTEPPPSTHRLLATSARALALHNQTGVVCTDDPPDDVRDLVDCWFLTREGYVAELRRPGGEQKGMVRYAFTEVGLAWLRKHGPALLDAEADLEPTESIKLPVGELTIAALEVVEVLGGGVRRSGSAQRVDTGSEGYFYDAAQELVGHGILRLAPSSPHTTEGGAFCFTRAGWTWFCRVYPEDAD